MNKKLLQQIEALFFAKLQLKTGWGRNEVMAAYHDAQREAMLELLDSPVVQSLPRMPPLPEAWPEQPAVFTANATAADDKPPFDEDLV